MLPSRSLATSHTHSQPISSAFGDFGRSCGCLPARAAVLAADSCFALTCMEQQHWPALLFAHQPCRLADCHDFWCVRGESCVLAIMNAMIRADSCLHRLCMYRQRALRPQLLQTGQSVISAECLKMQYLTHMTHTTLPIPYDKPLLLQAQMKKLYDQVSGGGSSAPAPPANTAAPVVGAPPAKNHRTGPSLGAAGDPDYAAKATQVMSIIVSGVLYAMAVKHEC